MFTLNPNPTFKSEVSFLTPSGPAKITVVFRHKGRKALKAFMDSLTDAKPDGSLREDIDIVSEIVDGWEGVDVEFSKEALDTLLDNYPSSARAILDAYLPALVEGQAKN